MKKILSVLGAVFLGIIFGYGLTYFVGAKTDCQMRNPPMAMVVTTSHPRSEKIAVKNSAASRKLHQSSSKLNVIIEERPIVKSSPIIVLDQSNDQLIVNNMVDKRIDISLSGQTIEVFEGDKLVFSGSVSTAPGGKILPVGEGDNEAHNHVGSWPIFKKEILYRSRAYHCNMHYCLFFCQGHAIHAAQPSDIDRLGTAVSHGCIRVHPDLAKQLYKWADIGTMVTVHE